MYKKLNNNVEAFDSNGKSLGVLFETTSPFDTPIKMEYLVGWVNDSLEESLYHPLLIIAVFITHFLAIANRNTVKAHIKRLVREHLLIQKGKGRGSWYTTP